MARFLRRSVSFVVRRHEPMHRLPVFRLLWCALGSAAGIGLALFLVAAPASRLLLASLGGSAVFLFGLTRAPAAQPRALFGGHLGGAFIGIACYQAFGDALWVYVLAQVLALRCMLLTKTVHPPAGADPLIMIYGHASLLALWQLVFLGVFSLAGGGGRLESSVPGPVALSGSLARSLAAVNFLGRLGRVAT